MSGELLPGPLDDSAIVIQAGETEYDVGDGRIVMPMFFVGAVEHRNGHEYVAPLSPLVHTFREAMADQENLDPPVERSAILWVHRLFEPHRPEDQASLEQHRKRALAARAEGAQ